MLDAARHPDIDETKTWRNWGEVLEAHPQMLGGILALLPEAATVEEGNRRILALYLWLSWAEHRNVVVTRQPVAGESEGVKAPSAHDLENHANPAPLGLRITGQNRHIDPPSHLSMPPSWQVLSTAAFSHEQGYQWPHLPGDEVLTLLKMDELAGWLEAIHYCEMRWLSAHPDTVVARLTAVGELQEEPNGNLHLPSATWEGMDRLIHLPVHQRTPYTGHCPWIRRFVQNEDANAEARRLREALAPADLLRDQRFANAAIQVSFHPPSQARLADIERDRLAELTGGADATKGRARL